MASLVGCMGVLPGAAMESAQPHHCAEIDGADDVASKGDAVCEAKALGGEANKATARANGKGSDARAVAGSLDLFDNGKPDDYLSSDNNTSLALATNGAGALARSGVNKSGKKGVGGNNAVARADGSQAFADASAANGNHNAATSVAEECVGASSLVESGRGPFDTPGKRRDFSRAKGQACAFSVAGNGDHNVATALTHGEGSKAQAGALDGNHNSAVSTGKQGGRAFTNAQAGDNNSADAMATGDNAFSSAQATGSDSFALSRADGANSTANATAQKGGAARALAEAGATATASASGIGFTAIAFASGIGTTATATHDEDTDTGSCSGPGVAFAMTGGSFHCVQGF